MCAFLGDPFLSLGPLIVLGPLSRLTKIISALFQTYINKFQMASTLVQADIKKIDMTKTDIKGQQTNTYIYIYIY